MASSRAPAVVALFIGGCAAPAPPPPTNAPVPLPRPLAISAPSAVPSASPAAAPAPIDPAADRDKLAIVQSICAAAIKHVDGKVLVGCRACPPFESASARPDGAVAIDPPDFYALELAAPGAFTRPGATEVAAVFQGCEAHSDNFGGTLLVEKTASGYQAKDYHSGVHPDSCQPYRRPDGRDLLVCKWSDVHQSTGFTQLFVYDFTQGSADDVQKGWKELAIVHDTSSQLCMGIDPTGGVDQGRLVGYRFEDRNRDGRLDVVIDVEHRHTASSAALIAKIDRACKQAPTKPDEGPSVDAAALLGKPVKATIELIFDGQSFKPTASSAKTLKGL